MWRLLDREAQLKYKDVDYLATLPNPFGRGDCDGPDGGTSAAARRKNKSSRFFREAETERWSRKLALDVSDILFLWSVVSTNYSDLSFS